MGLKDRLKGIQDKIKTVQKKVKSVKTKAMSKAEKNRAKSEIRKTEKLAKELGDANKRLSQLKSAEAIYNKKKEISILESKLTTKGQLLSGINKTLDYVAKEGGKQLKKQINTRNTRKRKSNKSTTKKKRKRTSNDDLED